VPADFVAAVVVQLSRQYPRIVFHLEAADAGMTLRALEARNVDLAVAHINVPIAEERMRVDVLYHDSPMIVADTADGHRLVVPTVMGSAGD